MKVVKRSFDIDGMGIRLRPRINNEDERALSLLENLTKCVNGGWESCFLGKLYDMNIPNHYSGALNRLQSIKRKMYKV